MSRRAPAVEVYGAAFGKAIGADYGGTGNNRLVQEWGSGTAIDSPDAGLFSVLRQ